MSTWLLRSRQPPSLHFSLPPSRSISAAAVGKSNVFGLESCGAELFTCLALLSGGDYDMAGVERIGSKTACQVVGHMLTALDDGAWPHPAVRAAEIARRHAASGEGRGASGRTDAGLVDALLSVLQSEGDDALAALQERGCNGCRRCGHAVRTRQPTRKRRERVGTAQLFRDLIPPPVPVAPLRAPGRTRARSTARRGASSAAPRGAAAAARKSPTARRARASTTERRARGSSTRRSAKPLRLGSPSGALSLDCQRPAEKRLGDVASREWKGSAPAVPAI